MPASSNQPEPSPNAPRDLFLSYHSRDRAAVLRVQQLLHERNLSTFFDRNQLSAGSRWVSLLESEVGSSRAVAVFIGPHGLGDWQEMEMQLALVRQIDEQKANRQFPIIPLILPGATPEKELGFLKLYTWVDLRARLDDPAKIDELECAVRGDAREQLVEAAVELCPYRALQAFREQDEKLFFGRDRCAEQLLQQARNERLKLIAVVGPSGSGKSSVVQAGLLPRLRRERPPHLSWEAAIFTPGKAPFHELAKALLTVGIAEQDRWARLSKAEELGQKLSDGHIRFEAAIATALAEAPGAHRLLLVVDQAEELFTQTPEQERQPFIQRLLAAANAAPVTIVLTLRADFYGQAISFSRELGELIIKGQVNVPPMSRDELRRAIIAPAEIVTLQFEDGLVERLLDHVADQPGNLPLLEYALTQLWERRQGGLISHRQYEEIGTIEGVISQLAEEQFASLSPARQEVALRVLPRLVRVADANEEGADTRQRVRLGELDPIAQSIVQLFVAAYLLVTSRNEATNEVTVEIAHESLIRRWPRLRNLLDKDRPFLLWRQRLALLISEWQRNGRDAGYLLRGVSLAEAEQWLIVEGANLNDIEGIFIKISKDASHSFFNLLSALGRFGAKELGTKLESKIRDYESDLETFHKTAAEHSELMKLMNDLTERINDVKRAMEAKASELEQLIPQVFISYAREDEGQVRALYDKLKEMNCKPWLDKEDISPGAQWDRVIQKAVQHSDFLIICLSKKAISKRGYIQKEIRMALDSAQAMPDESIFVIPLRLEECAVPDSVSKYQYVDLFSSDGFDRLIKAIWTEWGRRKRETV